MLMGVVCLWFDQGVKKRDSPFLLITFDSELYCWIYTVNLVQKKLLMGLLLDDPCAIHKPEPIPGAIRGRPEGLSLKMFHIQFSYYRAA